MKSILESARNALLDFQGNMTAQGKYLPEKLGEPCKPTQRMSATERQMLDNLQTQVNVAREYEHKRDNLKELP